MKNKNILYLITILITLFSFNLNVNATQELTCVYEYPGHFPADKDNKTYKMMLIQDESGNKVIYINSKKKATSASEGWQKLSNVPINIKLDYIPESKKDEKGNLTVCPEYSNLNLNKEQKEAVFSETYEHGTAAGLTFWYYEKIENENSYQTVMEPVVQFVPFEQGNKEWLSTIDGNKYTGSCKYERGIGNGEKHTVVVNFGKNDISFVEYDPKKGIYSSVMDLEFYIHETAHEYHYKFNVDDSYTISEFLNFNEGNCPRAINVERKAIEDMLGDPGMIDEYITTVGKKASALYEIVDVRGENPLTGKKLSIGDIKKPLFNDVQKVEDCEDLVGEDIAKYFNIVWRIIKIGVPILLIGLGTFDFAQAVFAGKEDDMKKAQGKFIKRIIIAAAIFLIPTILSLLLNLANNVWGDTIGKDICGILF